MLKGKIALIVVALAIICSLAAMAIALYVYKAKPNIAYVNNGRVLAEFKGIIEAKQVYDQKSKEMKSNLDTLESDVNKDIKKYQVEAPKMSAKERELSEQLIKRKQQNYFNYKKAIDEKNHEQDQKLTTEVLKQIDSYLLNYGETHQYDYIFGITQTGNLLYARKYSDITDEIIAGLNKEYDGNKK